MARGIDQWRAKLGLGGESDENPAIEVLTPDAALSLRMPWLSRFNNHALSRHVSLYPGMALFVPASGEYIVAEPWRKREDIANIVEITARKGRIALIRRLAEGLKAQGSRLCMLADDVWRDNTRLYMDLGFGKIETIVFFEKKLSVEAVSALQDPRFPSLSYKRLGVEEMDLLLYLDHNSFPWLWWNSREEFEGYVQLPDVYAYIACEGDEPVGYASYTLYSGWAHLDRLAVVESAQGRGYGAAQLLHTLTRMIEAGSHDVALSTQETNVKSHRLYTRFGFHLTKESMSFYGIKLDPSITLE